MRREIRLSGFGGQGLILAGIILAEAGMLDGKEVVQTQSYGPEARGGASKAEVILADYEIDYPKVTSPEVLLTMSDVACMRYACTISPGGTMIIDSDLVKNIPDNPGKIHKYPITDLAVKTTGRAIAANIVALGIVNELCGLVSTESLEKAILLRVPKGTGDVNLRAFRAGIDAVRRG